MGGRRTAPPTGTLTNTDFAGNAAPTPAHLLRLTRKLWKPFPERQHHDNLRKNSEAVTKASPLNPGPANQTSRVAASLALYAHLANANRSSEAERRRWKRRPLSDRAGQQSLRQFAGGANGRADPAEAAASTARNRCSSASSPNAAPQAVTSSGTNTYSGAGHAIGLAEHSPWVSDRWNRLNPVPLAPPAPQLIHNFGSVTRSRLLYCRASANGLRLVTPLQRKTPKWFWQYAHRGSVPERSPQSRLALRSPMLGMRGKKALPGAVDSRTMFPLTHWGHPQKSRLPSADSKLKPPDCSSTGRISLGDVDFPTEGKIYHFKKVKANARLDLTVTEIPQASSHGGGTWRSPSFRDLSSCLARGALLRMGSWPDFSKRARRKLRGRTALKPPRCGAVEASAMRRHDK